MAGKSGVFVQNNKNLNMKYLSFLFLLPLFFGNVRLPQTLAEIEPNLELQITTVVVADFTLPSGIFCPEDTLIVTNSSTGATAYQWLLNGSPVSTDPLFNQPIHFPGIYAITLIATGPTGTDTLVQNLQVGGGILAYNFPNAWCRMDTLAEYLNLGDLDITGDKITVEAWVYVLKPGNNDIVSKHSGPSSVNYLLRPHNSQITAGGNLYIATALSARKYFECHHVAMVYDGTTLKHYINGQLDGQIAATGTLAQNNCEARIGQRGCSLGDQFWGYMTEWRLWNVARTQAQIQQYLYDTIPNAATVPGLVVYLDMGTLINKASGGPASATMVGAVDIGLGSPCCGDTCLGIIAEASASDSTFCEGLSTNLFSTGGGYGTYEWYYDGNLISTDSVFNFTANDTSGLIELTLVAIHNNCSDTDKVAINVLAKPDVDFVAPQNALCTGDTNTFANNSTGAISYQWQVNGIPVSTDPQFNYVFGFPGNYLVTLVAFGTFCNDSASQNVQVGGTLLTNNFPNMWCKMDSLNEYLNLGDLDITGNKITVEAWVYVLQPGNNDIVSKHGGPSSVNYLLRPHNSQVTAGGNLYIATALSSRKYFECHHVAMVYDGTTLKHYINGQLDGQIAATGTLVQNNCEARIGQRGCSLGDQFWGYMTEWRLWNVARTQAQIQQYLYETIPNPATVPGLVVYLDMGTLINKAAGGPATAAMVGAVDIGISSPCCSDSCIGITGTGFTYTQNVDTLYFTDTTNGSVAWAWDFGDLNTSNTQNPSHQYATDGNYNVCLTATYASGCSDTYCDSVVVILTGVSSINPGPEGKISLFPNPSTTIVNLVFEGYTGKEINIVLFDVLGRRVIEKTGIQILEENHREIIPVDQLGKGTYYFKISDRNSMVFNNLKVLIVR